MKAEERGECRENEKEWMVRTKKVGGGRIGEEMIREKGGRKNQGEKGGKRKKMKRENERLRTRGRRREREKGKDEEERLRGRE